MDIGLLSRGNERRSVNDNGNAAPVKDLTVMVFNDNFAARTFQVPLKWISRFGIVLGILVGAALLSSFFAIKFYRVARQADPSRVQDLEHELTDLKANYDVVAAKQQGAQSTGSTASTTANHVTPPASTGTSAASGDAPLLFSALPSKVVMANESEPSVQIHAPRVAWQGKTLKVSFDIQYVGSEKGSQQGRIILLARGPETLMAHPNGVLNGMGSDSLIAPDQGEYFSVSRFRTVSAEFGPMRSQGALREVEILLLNQEGQILVHQSLKPGAAGAPASGAGPATQEIGPQPQDPSQNNQE